jgi:hypothetical protein
MSGFLPAMSGPGAGPDTGFPHGINGLDAKCRKCRVFSAEERNYSAKNFSCFTGADPRGLGHKLDGARAYLAKNARAAGTSIYLPAKPDISDIVNSKCLILQDRRMSGFDI